MNMYKYLPSIYGIMHGIGILLMYLYTKYNYLDLVTNISSSALEYIFIFAIVFGYFGSRLMCLLQGDIIIKDFLKIQNGGLSVFGSWYSLLIYSYLLSIYFKTNFILISEIGGSIAPIMIVFGRIGNYLMNELNGKYSNYLGYKHPSQLYQCLFEGFLPFCFIHYFNIIKKYKYVLGNGYIFLGFPFGYAICRFILEFFREEDKMMPNFYRKYIRYNFNIRLAQFQCILLIIIYLLIYLIYFNII